MRSGRRYAVVGTGAVGGFYGGLLAQAGFDVHFLLHSDADHVRQHGLQIESTLGDFRLDNVNVYDAPESMPVCDVTILALKTTRNDLLPRLLPAPAGRDGLVLVLQNGLNVETQTAAVVGADRVLGGCCFLCSNKVGPGHIRHLDYGRIVFGRFTPADAPPAGMDAVVQSIADDLQSARIDAVPTGDLWLARWRKLMWNIPFNGLSVVLGASTEQLIRHPAAAALAEAIMREVRSGAHACGRTLPADAVETTMNNTRKMVPYDSSMRLDYLAGRPMELEAIFGNPLQAADAVGYDMPQVRMLYRQLCFLDAARSSR